MRSPNAVRALLAAVLVALAGCGGCKHEDGHAAAPQGPRAEPVVSPREVVSPATFDFVATGDGALLVWAAPRDRGSGIRSIALDAQGTPRGPDRSVAPLSPGILVLELAAAAGGGRAGVAWIEARPPVSAVVVTGTHGDARGEAYAPKVDEGTGVRLHGEPRGRLALSASDDGTLSLAFRAPPGPCRATAGTCAHYVHVRLGDPQGQGPRGIETMEVQVPCEALVGASAWAAGTWFTAVCSAEHGPTAHVFSIRPEISYASVADGPAGCPADGVVVLPDGVAVRGRCADASDVVMHLGVDGRASPTLTGVRFDLRCDERRHPTLRALAAGGASGLTLTLEEPRSHVEAMLGADLAPRGARAVWTGEALLVAVPTDRDVFVRRYACDGPGLRRTDPVE